MKIFLFIICALLLILLIKQTLLVEDLCQKTNEFYEKNKNYKNKYEHDEEIISQLNKQLKSYEDNIKVLKQADINNTDKISELEKEINKLKNDYSVLLNEKNILSEELKQKKAELLTSTADKQLINSLKSDIKNLTTENSNLKQQIAKSAKTDKIISAPEVQKLDKIADFMQLNESNQILFDESNVEESLQKIKDCSVIKNFLADNNSSHIAEMYSDYIEDYLAELEDCFDNMKCDEDEISQEYTIKFSKILSKYFIERIVEKAFEDYNYNDFSKSFVNKIKEYLSKNCIYTKPVKVGEVIDTSYLSVAHILKTDDNSLHRVISEVVLPPFYIKYVNGFGKAKEKLVCKGKVIVYSTKN